MACKYLGKRYGLKDVSGLNLNLERAGTMGCKLYKLHWYPKLNNYVILFVVT